MSKRIFENLRLLVLTSPELRGGELKELCSICDEHNVPYIIKDVSDTITKEEFVSGGFTHIISNTVLFDLYSYAQETLIPVTTARYISATAEKGKPQTVRPYSPDPRHVLKDVHVCVGALPLADKEAIHGGVRALGGTFSDTLSVFVTHVISADPHEDCVIAAHSVKNLDIKAVHPLWIEHSLILRKKLDETPYLLGVVPVEEQEKTIKQLDVINNNAELVRSQKKFLSGKVFYLGKDLQLTDNAEEVITSLIVNCGGIVVDSLNKCKFYIGQFRDGDEYITASRNKLYVGNLNWIYWMVEHQKWIAPYTEILHYPYVRGGMHEMKEFVISSTNYTGDARFYITKLVEALGATFTNNLRQSNTHLISSIPSGKKYTAALKWELKIVNHLWLEECYSSWKLQPYNHPRYASILSEKTKHTDVVGKTPLDPNVLKMFYEDGISGDQSHIIEDSEDDGDAIPSLATRGKATLIESKCRSQKPDSVDMFDFEGATEKEEDLERELKISPFQEAQEWKENQDEVQEANEDQVEVQEAKKHENEDEAPGPTVELPRHDDKENAIITSIESKAIFLKTDVLTPKRPNLSNIEKIHTPRAPALKGLDYADIRPSSGRKAKDKAAQKLHEDMEQLNYFQRQQKSKSKDAPLLPEEIEERKRRREEEQKSKSLSVEPEEVPVKESPSMKKTRKESTVQSSRYDMNIISSGCDLTFGRADLQILSNLGITISKELKEGVNTIVAPKLMRTEKLLVGLSHKLEYIISPEFLTDVVNEFKEAPTAVDKLPDPKDYSIDKVNKASVKALTPLTLSKLLSKSRERVEDNRRLFKGISFNITPKIPGGASTAQKILKAHGCKDVRVIKTIKEMKTIKALKHSSDGSVMLISAETGFNERFKELLEDTGTHGTIVVWDWVIASIFKMDIDSKNVAFSF